MSLSRLVRAVVALSVFPAAWRLPILGLSGIAFGLGIAGVHLSRAPSYMSDAPETCMNCHVMGAAYSSWSHSSHGRVTTCTDCHVPHDTMIAKYLFKAQDGLRHSTVFTMRSEPQVMALNPVAVPVVEANCRRCHESVVGDVHAKAWQSGDPRCWDCHRETPHGIGRSLSALDDTFRPTLPMVFADPRTLEVGGRAPRPTAPPVKESP